MGLHGAALTHGIFMSRGTISIELKTLYGQESMLFGLIADSRDGIHGQVDIKKYFVPGGHRPMDNTLVIRTIQTIKHAILLQQQYYPEVYNQSSSSSSSSNHHRHLSTTNKKSLAPRQPPKKLSNQQTNTQEGNNAQTQPNASATTTDITASILLSNNTQYTANDFRPKSISIGKQYEPYIHIIPENGFERDFVYAAIPVISEIDHVLGPSQQNHKTVCESLMFHKLRTLLGMKDHSFHCDICTKYVV